MKSNEQFILTNLSKPPTKITAIPVDIRRIVTDVDGQIINKATLPANLQVEYPVYLWGQYDAAGGYQFANQSAPAKGAALYLCSYIYAVNNPFFYGFTLFGDVNGQLYPGDCVTVYTDDYNSPNYFIFIVQTVSKSSLGAIRVNSATHSHPDYSYIEVTRTLYYSDNQNEQYTFPLVFIRMKDRIGNFASDMIEPRAYKPPIQINQNFITIPTRFNIDQYLGITTYIAFNTDVLQLNFVVKTPKSKSNANS